MQPLKRLNNIAFLDGAILRLYSFCTSLTARIRSKRHMVQYACLRLVRYPNG